MLVSLGLPHLDPREARLVPFARETMRYQTSAIQRRTRAVAEGLDPAAVLEAVGIAALANAV